MWILGQKRPYVFSDLAVLSYYESKLILRLNNYGMEYSTADMHTSPSYSYCTLGFPG